MVLFPMVPSLLGTGNQEFSLDPGRSGIWLKEEVKGLNSGRLKIRDKQTPVRNLADLFSLPF